ncbi:hypothetical protein [Chelativorans xinjiangense]|uniref:hypothetical protein n=1 Tax=Chelativorans xinjiangense TaxID=2681485 RepID=UPI00135ACA24|nr:hypothetical protein [Chelativorans xinjiangense]
MMSAFWPDHAFGPFYRAAEVAPVLIDRTSGTAIGDMTEVGGLAASFDGIDDQSGASSSAKTATLDAFVGKTLAVPAAIDHIVCYGANNQGFLVNDNGDATIELRAKQGVAPTLSSEGTLLGSITFTDTSVREVKTINSNDTTTLWDHVWIRILPATLVSTRNAELEIWAAG